MLWYYQNAGQRIGPIAEEDLRLLIENGIIQSTTPVWNEALDKWIPLGKVPADSMPHASALTGAAGGPADAPPAPTMRPGDNTSLCRECGRSFPVEDMLSCGKGYICAGCQPRFIRPPFQETVPEEIVFSGFWDRAGAWIFDNVIIVACIDRLLSLLLGIPLNAPPFQDANLLQDRVFVLATVSWLIGLLFQFVFLGAFGATLGKMGFSIKVARSDGGRIGYGRALARIMASQISLALLGLGYMMAYLDPQKRTLHDLLCGTRVMNDRKKMYSGGHIFALLRITISAGLLAFGFIMSLIALGSSKIGLICMLLGAIGVTMHFRSNLKE